MAYLETCDEHDNTIAYASTGQTKCPACSLQQRIDELEAEVKKLEEEIDTMEAE